MLNASMPCRVAAGGRRGSAGAAVRGARGTGAGRGADLAQRPRPAAGDVPGGGGPQPRAGAVGRGRLRRGRPGSAPRRPAHRLRRLAVDLPDQRPGRRRRAGHQHPRAPRDAIRGMPAPRPPRSDTPGDGLGIADARARATPHLRARRHDPRAAWVHRRPGGRPRRRRAPPSQPGAALLAPDVPRRLGRERHPGAHRRRDRGCAVLLDAVPAAHPRLLTAGRSVRASRR
jgi:hypothetical protein